MVTTPAPLGSDPKQEQEPASIPLTLMHVTGASYPGVPFVTISGRTGHVSWSLTPSTVDTADLFQEQIRVQEDALGEVAYEYLHSRGSGLTSTSSSAQQAGVDTDSTTHTDSSSSSSSSNEEDEEEGGEVWKPAVLRRETITVRPVKRETTPSEVSLDCLETERGVVLPASSFTSFAASALHSHSRSRSRSASSEHSSAPAPHLSWLSLASVDRLHPLHMSSWLQLNTAQSWTDFNTALEDMDALSWNALYADTSNNIGSRVTGR